MKPLIAIISLYDETKESYWMLPGYAEALEQAGACPVILPPTNEEDILQRYVHTFGGFLFPGGHDLAPELYGGQDSGKLGPLCPLRDEMERRLFPMALESRKPLLGICRGIQLFNCMLGGDLYQDIPTEHPSSIEHHETPPYDKAAHPVAVAAGSLLRDILERKYIKVNSYHHQGIRRLGRELVVNAMAPDGIIEAVSVQWHPFALAVQWHPEFSYKSDENSREIFAAFVEACRKQAVDF